ncbi:MAG: signal peptidase II [Candidatus Pacebacteria bacterium]|nr:signal peptidase II [Candidatus Paceibacterota bacterium]
MTLTNRIKLLLLALLLTVGVVLADQVSKAMVRDFFSGRDPVLEYGSYFMLVSAWNTGVSFSLFAESGRAGAIFFTVLALVVSIGLLVWLFLQPLLSRSIAVGLVAGGAIGNGLDRLRFGAVYDFLYFHIGSWGWPAFNLADSTIVIGVGIIILFDLFKGSNKSI